MEILAVQFFIFFKIWLKAIALTRLRVGNSSTVRGHFKLIPCLVDQTKLLNNTRRHIPKAGTVSSWCSWLSTLGQTLWSGIKYYKDCLHFRSLPNMILFSWLTQKRYKTKVKACCRTCKAQQEIVYWNVDLYFFILYVSYRPPTTLIWLCLSSIYSI